MTLTIREASLKDVALLNELACTIYPAHFKHMWVSVSDMNEFMAGEYGLSVLEQSLKDDGVSWFVAETKHPVGFAKMIWETPIPETPVSGALLSKLYLSPDHTGKKYGRQLFEHMVKLARQRGASFLWLEVLAQNERARQFYQQRGMQSIKETRLITASQQSVLKIMGMSI